MKRKEIRQQNASLKKGLTDKVYKYKKLKEIYRIECQGFQKIEKKPNKV